jgi:hypothetical protein
VNALPRVKWIAVVPILVAGVLFTSWMVTDSSPATPTPRLATDIHLADHIAVGDDRGGDGAASAFVDLYGNEVTDAIATYTFDQAGSLYELHSPQTELPRLGIPKS